MQVKDLIKKGLQFLGIFFLGLVYEAHQKADPRSKTVTLTAEPPVKLNPYKIYDWFTNLQKDEEQD